MSSYLVFREAYLVKEAAYANEPEVEGGHKVTLIGEHAY